LRDLSSWPGFAGLPIFRGIHFTIPERRPVFTPELLDVLPPQVRLKVQRMAANGRDAGLLARTARYLDLHGAHTRFVTHGVRPAHVVPTLPGPVRNHVAAVEEARQRLAELDAYAARLDASVAAGELLPVWRDVFMTDAGLARLAWERIEEVIVTAAEDAGVSIARRPDLDPAALLEIERA
jgi:hypothetical protein